MMRLIAENLGGERSGQPVFSAVDFSLGAGQCLIITGPNGVGKSTLLRVVAGLLPGASGSVRLEDGGDHFPTVASASHYLGHLNAMKPAMTVIENLCFWQEFCGDPAVGVAEALDLVGLGGIGHLPYGYLSTGQRRRISIAKLLVSRRPVWILDEPSAGLDRQSERQLVRLMAAHLGEGGMIVAATHQPLGIEGATKLEMRADDDAILATRGAG